MFQAVVPPVVLYSPVPRLNEGGDAHVIALLSVQALRNVQGHRRLDAV
ncbi:hypothetical protein [Ruegeria sp. HKCCA5426]|nr:hypothetical protein [Ruegeria sp. HKCCA5426]